MLLTVSCSSIEQSGKCIALLDPAIMAAQGISVGDVIEIRSHSGRSTLAKVAVPLAEDNSKGVIRIDHYLRQAIKVAPGQEVDVKKIIAQPISRVFLMSLVHTFSPTEELKSHIQNILVADSLPFDKESIICIALPDDLGTATLQATTVEPGPGIITENTEIEMVVPGVKSEHEHEHGHEHELPAGITYDDVGGLDKEIKMVRELIEVPLRFPQVYRHLGITSPRGIIFHGPPGVGKTYLALALANEIDAEFFYINGPEIVSTGFGETETRLRGIFQEASRHTPSIVLIDELDVIIPKRGESGSFTTTRTVSQLLTLLDGLRRMEGMVVIGTTNRIDSVDEAARRPGRFDREIFLSPPDSTARLEILRVHSRAMPLSEEAAGHLEEIARKTIGFVGADLMELCREAGLNTLRRKFGDDISNLELAQAHLERLVVDKTDLESALGKIRPSAMREVQVTMSDIGWDDIGGLSEVKEQLQELAMPLLYPETFAPMKIEPPPGILLHGQPGTGKTMLAKALARECEANFIPVQATQIFSKWLGESEGEIRYIFQLARRVAPTIIFLDQIDVIAPRRGKDISTQATERVVSQLLTEIDSIQPTSRVVVVAATNRIDLIDPAVLQASRFGSHILVPLPDEAERKDILRIYLKDVPLSGETRLDEVVETLAASTEGFSAAELASLCQRTKILALRNTKFERSVALEFKHFTEVLAKLKESRIAPNP